MSKATKTKKSKNVTKRNYKYFLSVLYNVLDKDKQTTLTQFKNLLEKMDHIERCQLIEKTEDPVSIGYNKNETQRNNYYNLVVLPYGFTFESTTDKTITFIYYDPNNIENLFTLLYGLLIGFNRHASFAFHKELTKFKTQFNTNDTNNKITKLKTYHNLLFKDLTLKIDSYAGAENAEKNNYDAFKYKLYIDCVNNKCNVDENVAQQGGANPITKAYTAIKTRIRNRLNKRRTRKVLNKLQSNRHAAAAVNNNFNKNALLPQANNTPHIPVVLHISNNIPDKPTNTVNTYTIVNYNNYLGLTNFVLFNNVGFPYPIGNALMYFTETTFAKNSDQLQLSLNKYKYSNSKLLEQKKIISELSLTADELKIVYDSEAGVARSVKVASVARPVDKAEEASESLHDIGVKPHKSNNVVYANLSLIKPHQSVTNVIADAGYMEVTATTAKPKVQSPESPYLNIGSQTNKRTNALSPTSSSSSANRTLTPPTVIGSPPSRKASLRPPQEAPPKRPPPKQT